MLRDRVQRAKAAAVFAAIREKTRDGKVKAVEVPGRDGRRYLVEITREYGWLTTECRQISPHTGKPFKACPGNSNGHVCYHSIAAVLVASNGKADLSFCQEWEQAELLTRLGGRNVQVSSRQGYGRLWAVVREVK